MLAVEFFYDLQEYYKRIEIRGEEKLQQLSYEQFLQFFEIYRAFFRTKQVEKRPRNLNTL